MRGYSLISLLLLALFTSGCGNSKGKNAGNSVLPQTDTGKAVLAFREYEHNFGKVSEGEKVGHIFTFMNKGTSGLVIASATASCGCTVPKYNTKPVPPGESGNLEVVFDTSGRSGMQTKTISVKSNASTPVILIRITAEVITNNN